MECILTIKIGDESIDVTHDGSLSIDSIDSGLITVLKKSGKWPEIISAIETRLQNKIGSYDTVSIKDLTTEKGLIGNSNIQFLQDQFPSITFPENIDVNILFLDKLKLGGKEHFGRYTKSDGTELFIIRNNEYDVNCFANFLNLRELVRKGINLDEKSEQYQILSKIAKKEKTTIEELILNFSTNKEKYRTKIVTVNGKQIIEYNALDKTLREILELPARKEYKDPIINNINQSLKYSKVKGKWVASLNINNLYTILSNHKQSLLEKDITLPENVTSFKKIFGSDQILTEEQKSKYKNGYEMLLDLILDKSFQQQYKSHDGVSIKFKVSSRKIGDRFDIAYDTIRAMEIVDQSYNGYKIYKQVEETSEGTSKVEVTYYYPSRHYLTEDTITSRFETLEEAKEYVDNKNKEQDLYENSYIDFIYPFESIVSSPKLIEEGTIIEVRDFNTTKKDTIYATLFNKGNKREDFERIIKSRILDEKIQRTVLDKIITPEDMLLLINEIISNDITDEEINDLADKIVNSPKKAYYIESRESKFKYGTGVYYNYKVIQTEPNVVEQFKTQRNIPTVTLINNIATSFADKFGVKVHVLNKEQLEEQFPDIDEDAKAFIRNGEIYINTFSAKSSDLLHEYTHLLLGVLKSNEKSRGIYEQLLDMVVSTNEGRALFDKIEFSYEGISEMDIREEVFAHLFGDYLSGRGSDINNIFVEQERFLKEETGTIFDLSSDSDLRSIYNKSLKSIFGRFSSDVATKLKEDNGLDFSTTVKSRKMSDWVNKQIKEGKIKEDCSG